MHSIFKYAITSFACLLLIVPSLSFADSFYQWRDESGVAHYADSLSGVPPKYRDQVSEKEFKKKGAKSTVRQNSGSIFQGNRSNAASSRGRLKRIEIKYKAYEGSARRIIIPVTFNGSVTVPMILDTGAPGLVISPRLANKLGLYDNDEGKLAIRAGGIGGSVPAVLTIINTVSVGEAKDKFVPATITHSISDSFEGLVGMDFLSNFSITIDTRRHILVLAERPSDKNEPAGHDETWWKINFHRFAGMRTAWRNYRDFIKARVGGKGDMERRLKFAEDQYRQAEKLFRKLDRYASQNSVPTHWRKY